MTPQARRTHQRAISDEERAQIKREVIAEVRDAMYAGDDIDSVREALDEAQPEALSYPDIANMDETAINANWAEVCRVLEAGPDAVLEPWQRTPAEPSGPRKTGQGLISEGQNGPAEMSWERLRGMSQADHVAQRAAVDEFLARQGRR